MYEEPSSTTARATGEPDGAVESDKNKSTTDTY